MSKKTLSSSIQDIYDLALPFPVTVGGNEGTCLLFCYPKLSHRRSVLGFGGGWTNYDGIITKEELIKLLYTRKNIQKDWLVAKTELYHFDIRLFSHWVRLKTDDTVRYIPLELVCVWRYIISWQLDNNMKALYKIYPSPTVTLLRKETPWFSFAKLFGQIYACEKKRKETYSDITIEQFWINISMTLEEKVFPKIEQKFLLEKKHAEEMESLLQSIVDEQDDMDIVALCKE